MSRLLCRLVAFLFLHALPAAAPVTDDLAEIDKADYETLDGAFQFAGGLPAR